MPTTVTLSNLRNGIQEIYRELMCDQPNGEVPNPMLLEKVRAKFSKEIDLLTPDLANIALTKLLNEVSNRRGRHAHSSGGFNLFGEYGVPSAVTIIRGRKKATAKLSFREAKLYLEAHSRKSMSDRYEALRRLIEACRDYVESDEDTLEILVERKRKAEEFALTKIAMELIPA